MENKEILDKIIEGNQVGEQVKIHYNDDFYVFTLKPLTSGQLVKLQKLERKGLNINGMSKKNPIQAINAGELAENQTAAMHTGISYSLDAPLEKVKQLPLSIIEQLFCEIIRISNLTEKELILVKNFQSDN